MKQSGEIARKYGFNEISGQLENALHNLEASIKETEELIDSLEQKIDTMFEDLSEKAYNLYGVFMHDGGANYGHYWHFLYDAPQKRWLKYNDSLITEVVEDQVFENTTGKSFSAFSLIYVEESEMIRLTSPFVRSESYREYYRNLLGNVQPLLQ